MTKYSVPGTRRIGVRPATNALHAVRYAEVRGRPLTHAITINWDRLGVSNEDALILFQKLRTRVRRHWSYLRKTTGPAVGHLDDIGSQENPGGHRNTHWGVAIAPELVERFEEVVRRRLTKLIGKRDLGEALHFAPIYAPGGYAKYILKGVDPNYGGYFHIRPEDQGFVAGRGRTFVARSLSFTARKQAGWVRRKSKDQHAAPAAAGRTKSTPAT